MHNDHTYTCCGICLGSICPAHDQGDAFAKYSKLYQLQELWLNSGGKCLRVLIDIVCV